MRYTHRLCHSVRTNIFLSHSWDIDAHGRSTHQRATTLAHLLEQFGWNVWLDEENMFLGCNIDVQMANGILSADVICICITRRYIEKINSQCADDNCVKEFNLSIVSGKRIFPLIFEDDMLDIRNWPKGVAQMYFAHTFYLDCTAEIQSICTKLARTLVRAGLTSSVTDRSLCLSKIGKKQTIKTCVTI